MCGIAGQLNVSAYQPASPDHLARMLNAMIYRGPDDEGRFVEGPVSLGMRRLSIIDVEGGHQPIFNEDRTKVVVFNGEIYNYVELRDELTARGHTFGTHSDTEVIVHLYEEMGERCVEKLNGMFAIALWDAEKRQLLLARDRLGIKPLHYCATGQTLLFASEIGCLTQLPEITGELDAGAIDDYFTFFYIPGQQSVYRSIRKLPPATTAVWRDGHVTYRRYWQLEYRPPKGRPQRIEHYAELYREQLKRAVRLQLRSDVPLGVFLSGGLDSGSLLGAIRETTGQDVETFTVGFDEPSYDESAYAKATSDMYGTTHHRFAVTPDDMKRSGDLIAHFGEPYGPFTLVQSHMISRYSRDYIKVALAGDGGDELFGGYPTYIASRLARKYLCLPRFLRAIIRGMVGRLPVSNKLMSLDFKLREFVRGAEMFARGGNMAWKVIFNDAERDDLLTKSFRRDTAGRDPFAHVRELMSRVADASRLDKAMYVDLSMFLPDCVLTCTDRMSMAASQEVRVPILDHELVEFAAGVPDKYKLHRGQTKRLVREALKNWLPKIVLNKPKSGFTTPVPVWIRGPLKEYVRDILSPPAVAATGILNSACVERLLDEHMAARADHGRRIWALVNFMLWHQQRKKC